MLGAHPISRGAQLPWEPGLVPLLGSSIRNKLWDPSVWLEAQGLEPSGHVQLSLLIAGAQSQPSVGWNPCLHQISTRGNASTHPVSHSPGTHHSSVSFSLEISLEMPVLPCFPCFWAVAVPPGTWHWGSPPNHPKTPLTAPYTPNLPAEKMGKCSSMRVMSFQGQKVADEFALSAWRRSCDITQKLRNIEFLGGSQPPAQGCSHLYRCLAQALLEKLHLSHS